MQHRNLFFLLTLMAGMTALSIDIYLPSMPALAAVMKVEPGTIGLTVSIFILSFAFGQLIYGPLSDRFGRRRPLLAGLVLYFVANLICAFADSIDVLLFGRFLQGLGACAGSVIAQAVVRDVARGSEGTKVLASVASATALAPIIAPMIGGLLETYFSWRASFGFLALFGGGLMLLLFRALPETAPLAEDRADKSAGKGRVRDIAAVLRGYLTVSRSPTFAFFTVLGSLASAGLFSFISTSSSLMVGRMGFSPDVYGVLFGTNAATYMIGSIIAKKLAGRLDNRALALVGVAAMALGGSLMAISGVVFGDHVVGLLLPMAVVTMGTAMVSPAGVAGSMEPFGDQAGTASALHGFFRFSAAALMSAVLGLVTVTVAVLGFAIALCGVVGLLLPSMVTVSAEAPREAVTG